MNGNVPKTTNVSCGFCLKVHRSKGGEIRIQCKRCKDGSCCDFAPQNTLAEHLWSFDFISFMNTNFGGNCRFGMPDVTVFSFVGG